MSPSNKVKQERIVMKALAATIVTVFSGGVVPTAQAEHGVPAYVNTLRRAIVFEDDPGSRLSLAERMKRWKVLGMSVAIIDDCKIVDRHGFGITRESGIEVRSDTLFQAASVTKPVAAFAALRLVDQGLLSLDSDVNAELRSWKVPASPFLEGHPVTLRGILSHSAGLIPGGYGGYSRGEPVPTLIQTLSGAEPARPKPVQVAYVPGSDWRYSGGGYLVAQRLMTDKTGHGFERIVRDRVLEPIGMIRSGFAEPSTSRDANVAAGHVADGTMVPGGWHIYPELAAASLWSTAPDLAGFGLAVMKAVREEPNAMLSPALAGQMATAHAGPRSLGFEVGGEGRARHLGHDGTNEGYNSSLILYPETCQGAAIMANSDNAKPLIAELLRSIADTHHWPDTMPSQEIKRDPQSPVPAARFQGTYSFTDISGVAPFKIISAGDGNFTFDRGDGHREPLYASSEGLVGPDSGITIKAISPENGPAEHITYSRIGGRGAAKAKRVEPAP
jgi:CubicO group peptidase (beta-lactamase class C family)